MAEKSLDKASSVCRRNVADLADPVPAEGGPQCDLSVPWVRGDEWAGSLAEVEEAWAAEMVRRCAPTCLPDLLPPSAGCLGW